MEKNHNRYHNGQYSFSALPELLLEKTALSRGGIPAMDHLTEIKVRGYHADFYGHVNNARYLEFLEEDRWAHLESQIDLNKWASLGLLFLVVNINVNYRKAVAVGEVLLLSTKLEKVGNRSGILRQEILLKRTGETAADALVTFVIRDKSGRAVTLQGNLLEEIKKIGKPVDSNRENWKNRSV